MRLILIIITVIIILTELKLFYPLLSSSLFESNIDAFNLNIGLISINNGGHQLPSSAIFTVTCWSFIIYPYIVQL